MGTSNAGRLNPGPALAGQSGTYVASKQSQPLQMGKNVVIDW